MANSSKQQDSDNNTEQGVPERTDSEARALDDKLTRGDDMDELLEQLFDIKEEDEDVSLELDVERFNELSTDEVQTLLGRLYWQKKQVDEDLQELNDKYLRTAAELDNVRKRATREKEEARKYGIEEFAKELLPAMDNLERALEHIETGEAQDEDLREGVQMVFKKLKSAMEKKGIEGFEAEGTAFDPEYHEAIRQVETSEHDTGTVIEQFQKGYVIHDRLLRPALVSVAKNVEDQKQEGSSENSETTEGA